MTGRLIFLTGPAASGKTRTGIMWSYLRERPTFFLDWDQVANVLRFADDADAESVEPLTLRYRRAADVCAAMAKATVEAGNDCILVGAWTLERRPEWEGTWDEVERLDPLVRVLYPSLETCLERNRSDASRQGPYAVPDANIEWSHAIEWRLWADDPRGVVLDTTALTIDEVVDALERSVTVERP